MKSSTSRTRSFVVVLAVYLIAFVVGAFVGRELEPRHSTLVTFAAADVVATGVVFLGSLVFNNSSIYDAYWSVAPMILALAFAIRGEAPIIRKVLVTGLVLLWGARLTWNWARGWPGLEHEDFRYADLRKTTGKAYWLVSFFGIHLMPTVLVYLGCFSLGVALDTGKTALGILDGLGLVVTLGAIAIEARADHELRRFRMTNQEPGRILDTGVWAHCRHPNYLGEVLFWWGLFLFAMAGNVSAYWVVVGPLSINLLFVGVSIPLMTQRALARRPAYAERITRVPALLPRPWRRVIRPHPN